MISQACETVKMQGFFFSFKCARLVGIKVPGVPSGDCGNWGYFCGVTGAMHALRRMIRKD